MQSINVADRLWFDEDLLGATLNFYSDCRPGGVLFRVGISFQSLQQCNIALSTSVCDWAIADGSLSIIGDREELSVAFTSLQGGDLQSVVKLRGIPLKTFKYVVSSLAFRQLISRN